MLICIHFFSCTLYIGTENYGESGTGDCSSPSDFLVQAHSSIEALLIFLFTSSLGKEDVSTPEAFLPTQFLYKGLYAIDLFSPPPPYRPPLGTGRGRRGIIEKS